MDSCGFSAEGSLNSAGVVFHSQLSKAYGTSRRPISHCLDSSEALVLGSKEFLLQIVTGVVIEIRLPTADVFFPFPSQLKLDEWWLMSRIFSTFLFSCAGLTKTNREVTKQSTPTIRQLTHCKFLLSWICTEQERSPQPPPHYSESCTNVCT